MGRLVGVREEFQIGLGQELTDWQRFQLEKLGPGYSYDPVTQIFSTPSGGKITTPFRGPRYSTPKVPAGSVITSGVQTPEQMLKTAYPEFTAFQAQAEADRLAEQERQAREKAEAARLTPTPTPAPVSSVKTAAFPPASVSPDILQTDGVIAPAGISTPGLPIWAWIAIAGGAVYLFTRK